jgi:hypothetical protein
LTQIRILFVVNATWWVAAPPFLFLLPVDSDASLLAVALALAVTTLAGAAVVLFVPVVSESVRLRVESADALVRSYLTRSILRIGFVDIPVAVGVVGWLATGWVLVYLVGVPFTLLAAARAAPTPQRIAIDQLEVDAQGATWSLEELLGEPARRAP